MSCKFVCFLMRDRKGVDSDGRRGEEELGEVEEETVIRIYCIKNSFNERENFLKKRIKIYNAQKNVLKHQFEQ